MARTNPWVEGEAQEVDDSSDEDESLDEGGKHILISDDSMSSGGRIFVIDRIGDMDVRAQFAHDTAGDTMSSDKVEDKAGDTMSSDEVHIFLDRPK